MVSKDLRTRSPRHVKCGQPPDREAPSPLQPPASFARTPGGTAKAAARSTGALHTALLGLGLRLPGASALLAPGAQNHLEGLPGFWALLGGHRVLRAKRYWAVRRDYGGTTEKSLGRKRVGSREPVQLPAKQANFPPNRLPASNYLPVPAPPRSASPEDGGARGEMGSVRRVGVLGSLKKWEVAYVLAQIYSSPRTCQK